MIKIPVYDLDLIWWFSVHLTGLHSFRAFLNVIFSCSSYDFVFRLALWLEVFLPREFHFEPISFALALFSLIFSNSELKELGNAARHNFDAMKRNELSSLKKKTLKNLRQQNVERLEKLLNFVANEKSRWQVREVEITLKT